MDVETFRWLLTADGQRLLARATEVYDAHAGDPVRGADALRRDPDVAGLLDGRPERAAAALTQASLRRRAADKLGDDAARMYFTADGLEQATRPRVAAHRAARLALAGPTSVLDLGCGIGSDLVALARAGLTVAGVDLDPVRVAVAGANLAALGLPGAAQQADGTRLDLAPFGAVFADPARRSGTGRVFDPDAFAPPWSFVDALLTGRAGARAAVVKAAPGIPHERVPAGVEAEWVSERGDVLEAALWSPALATVRRRATVIGAGRGLATLTDEEDPGPAAVLPVGRFLHEPDGAVIRAGLVTAVAARVDGWLLDPHIAYVSGDRAVGTPYARSYEVLERLPHQEKALRAALRARGIGRLTIKKRGVEVVPERLRQRLALRGDEEATLVLTRSAGRGTALLVRPLG